MDRSPPAPDWYEDPAYPSRVRYWDGEQWSEESHPLVTQGSVEPEVPLLDLTYMPPPSNPEGKTEPPPTVMRPDPLLAQHKRKGGVAAILCIIGIVLIAAAGSYAVHGIAPTKGSYCDAVRSYWKSSSLPQIGSGPKSASVVSRYRLAFQSIPPEAAAAAAQAPDERSRGAWNEIVSNGNLLGSELQAFSDSAGNAATEESAAGQAEGEVVAYKTSVAPAISTLQNNSKYSCGGKQGSG